VISAASGTFGGGEGEEWTNKHPDLAMVQAAASADCTVLYCTVLISLSFKSTCVAEDRCGWWCMHQAMSREPINCMYLP
jgi:hypothetical protein